MKNIVVLQKNDDGNVIYWQITEFGKKSVLENQEEDLYWEKGGTITLDELEEILDREILMGMLGKIIGGKMVC